MSQHKGESRPEPQPRRKLDGKFSVEGSRIVNTVSGEEIPEDEPLFLLRGRDHHALAAIHAYQEACESDCNELHRAGIQQTREKFCQFAAEHPERMKQPGITRHFRLERPEPQGRAKPAELTHFRGSYLCRNCGVQSAFHGQFGECPKTDAELDENVKRARAVERVPEPAHELGFELPKVIAKGHGKIEATNKGEPVSPQAEPPCNHDTWKKATEKGWKCTACGAELWKPNGERVGHPEAESLEDEAYTYFLRRFNSGRTLTIGQASDAAAAFVREREKR